MVKIHRDGFSVVWPGEKRLDGLECQPLVNIIFIHGLRGHPRETWETPGAHTRSDDSRRAKKNRGIRSIFGTKTEHSQLLDYDGTEPSRGQPIFWIEDFLSRDIPKARILTYGYNADVIGFFQANNKNSISQHGQDMKVKLERELGNDAPIIFVAHSLGGIIVKDALHRSKFARQRTKLIVFLGTPHRGSASADWGQIASNMARLALQDSNKKILETLEVNNEVLDNIHEGFKTIVHEDGLRLHSFQEARGISGMKGLHNKVVDDFSSKVDLPSAQETVETIDADHMQMTKYKTRDDSGYRAVSGVLKTFIARQVKAQEVVSPEIPLPAFDTVQPDTATISTAKVHFMVPFQRNGDLIGREKYIQSIEARLCVPNKYCRVALVGLGGIGKTRIALEYASKHEKSDSVSVFWVHTSTAERMEKAYQEIAKEAKLAGAEDPKVDQLQLVKQWLESKDSGDWVMVIDNADDDNLFYGDDGTRDQEPSSPSSELARHFPRRSNGSILLTTRNRKLGVKFAGSKLTKVGGVITIPAMSVSESKSLLVEKLEEDTYDDADNDLTELVEILENLPLALVQAAAFIGENSQSIGEYLRVYRGSDSSKIKLLSQNFEDDERDPDIKNPVAVTWAISFEQIKKNDRRAAELLSLMSVLDRQAIPKSLLASDEEEVELEKAFGTLKAFSLITPEQNRRVTLHRLVYLATRNWLSMNEELDSWTGKALVLLSKLFPKAKYENRETWMEYLPHALTILSSDHLPASEEIAQSNLLFRVSQALEQMGDYDPAEMTVRKSLDLREKVLEENDLQTLHALGQLGSVLWRQGRNETAEKIYRQVLDGFGERLGNEDPETLAILNNLGLVLDEQGKYEEAEKLLQQALSACEKILGEEHRVTLASVSNLATMFGDQGKYEAAEKLYRRALSAREKILGEEHPDTLMIISNLAAVLGQRGKYEESEKLHRRVLSAREKVLGEEHPDTLMSVNYVGVELSFQGKYEASEQLHRRALSGREKILGEEHLDTLTSVYDLATVLLHQDQYDASAKLHRRALSGREKTLGKEHPYTFFSVRELAHLFCKQGQYQTALPLYQKACAGLEKTLGSDHPNTQACARHHSLMLDEMRRDSENASVTDADT